MLVIVILFENEFVALDGIIIGIIKKTKVEREADNREKK